MVQLGSTSKSKEGCHNTFLSFLSVLVNEMHLPNQALALLHIGSYLVSAKVSFQEWVGQVIFHDMHV